MVLCEIEKFGYSMIYCKFPIMVLIILGNGNFIELSLKLILEVEDGKILFYLRFEENVELMEKRIVRNPELNLR